MGTAYVGFARAHPGLFALMFRSERLNPARQALREAIDATRTTLRTAAAWPAPGASRAPAKPLTPLQLAARATALWSLAHGFAMLLLDGRLDGPIRSLPANQGADSLLQAVLDTVRLGD